MPGDWVIQNSLGDQLLSFKVGPKYIEINWYRPGVRSVNPEGRDGPLRFTTATQAKALLKCLISIAPGQLHNASVTWL